MLTIHVADAVSFAGHEDVRAVVVDAGLIVQMGPYDAMTAARPQARVRTWPGLLVPGLRHPGAVDLLESAYHPDPREADALGTEPLTGDALAALELDDKRLGGSARRGLQRMLGHGVTAVTGPFSRPPVRTAVARSGLRVREPVPVRATEGVTLDPLRILPLSALLDGGLSVGAPADFAVFDVPVDEPPAEVLRLHGAGTCVATVLGGRLVYRRA
ncbi:hypothetical protein ACFWU3_31535 [Streptomyces sp. NPDC058685]|uniref:hypothetical protein n=1 Tax=Streptomyces sp. NPDC058685 TaxID=3346598 RepID=UPI003649ACC7